MSEERTPFEDLQTELEKIGVMLIHAANPRTSRMTRHQVIGNAVRMLESIIDGLRP